MSLHCLRTPFLLLLLLMLGGCATSGGLRADSAATATTDEGMLEAAAAAPAPTPDQLDPWQPFNRRMHAVNSVLDKVLLRPVAHVYANVTPKPLRQGLTNFFGNLQQPVSVLNLALQARPKAAVQSAGRFAMNVVMGLGGIFDPATEVGLPYYDKDFGQTFAQWGWVTSRYLVLPVFGPGTVRDTVGKGVNTTVSPVSWLAERHGAEISILYGVDARASVLAADAFLKDAEDEYLLVRDAYLQRRRCQLMDCTDDVPDYLLPDYDFEVPDFESIRR